MTPQQVSKFLAAAIPARLPVLLVGGPGCAKTSLGTQAAAALGYDVIFSHPVVSDPTDFKGIFWPDASGGRCRVLPVGEIADLLECERPTVWFIDDIGQAPPA